MKKGHEKVERQRHKELFSALLSLKNAEECQKFLDDLCTPAELQAISDRWHVARLLEKKIPYRQVYEQSGVSTATITRVARCLLKGVGGYRLLLSRLHRK
ncbi:MAG: YerC/YecD family TrpR-related protein [Deltaproteobacteria bacterium]|nr:YerC/YecD family TrpR-related protein [Deltaproteobacteria bacterium]